MIITDKSMMFELWPECNNQCTFCYLGHTNLKTEDSKKLENIKNVKNIVSNTFSNKFEQYKAIGLIGGEFFQGQLKNPEVKDSFFDLCKDMFTLIEADKVRDFWCYCTLTIGDQKDLYELIDLFDKMITNKDKHKFWILVSYDTNGRFNIPEKEENWKKHMLNLQKYPFILFNVTSILSQDFCEKVISGEHNILEFKKKYKISSFFFKQPTKTFDYKTKEDFAKDHKNWFLKRKTFIKFLEKLKNDDLDLFNHVLNIEQRADDILQSSNNFKGQHRDKITWEETDMEVISKCGHVIPYQCYEDSDECCLCDYFKIKGIK